VLSPDSGAIDRVIKRDEYATAGVRRYWMIDRDEANRSTPSSSTVAVRRRRQPTPLAWLLNGPVPELD
jgi:Uma2 family endonuclease